MEAEGFADWITCFERESVRERLAAEADAMLTLEKRAKGAADRNVLGLDEFDARVLQRQQQAARAQRKAAVAYAHRILVPRPLGAEVIAVQVGRVPGARIHGIAVPLHDEDVLRMDEREQSLQHEM